MAFWGVEVKPGKPFTHSYDDSKGRLHISTASLCFGNAKEKSILQINAGDKQPIVACCLRPNRTDSVQLHLEFEEDDKVVFSVIGPNSISLAGYFMTGFHYRHIREKSESYGEDIENSESQRSKNSDQDKYEDDFINDGDPGTLSPSSDGEKITHKKRKRLRKAYKIDESSDGECSQAKKKYTNDFELVSNKIGEPTNLKTETEKCLEDGNEIGEPTNLKTGTIKEKGLEDVNEIGESTNLKTGTEKGLEDGNEIGEPTNLKTGTIKKKGLEDGNEIGEPTNLKTRTIKEKGLKDGNEEDDNAIEQNSYRKLENDGMQSTESNPNDDDIGQLSRLVDSLVESLLPSEGDYIVEDVKDPNFDNTEPTIVKKIEAVRDRIFDEVQEKELDYTNNMDIPNIPINENNTSVEHNLAKCQVQILENGLSIEVLKAGKTNGEIAVSGSKLYVRYVGMFKNTGEVFDSVHVEKSYKFRLGSRKVIDGWEVGIEGMQVGEKRRITIPPVMGYGSEGDGEKIPPNSWLVYEVKLMKVR